MAEFKYKAKSGPDEVKEGIIQAENKAVVIKKLRQQGLYPISIEELNTTPPKRIYSRITSRDITNFTCQLANLVHSGFSLAVALSTLSEQEQHLSIKKLINDLYDRIQKGLAFSQALNAYPRLFSSFYINMINIGEANGKIDESLERLANFREKDDELVSQIRTAFTYPSFILIVGIFTIFVMVTFVIPRFVGMFADLGMALPFPTQVVYLMGRVTAQFWWIFVIIAAAVLVYLRAAYTSEKGRFSLDTFLLSIPLLKNIIKRVEIAKFAYALGVLLQSRVPILEALEVVSLSVDNRVFRKKIAAFSAKIRQGQSLSKCLRAEHLFPPVLINMVTVGEESGELSEMLSRAAYTFEAEANRSAKTIVSLIEPSLILVIGGFVILLVLSALLPIFTMDILVR